MVNHMLFPIFASDAVSYLNTRFAFCQAHNAKHRYVLARFFGDHDHAVRQKDCSRVDASYRLPQLTCNVAIDTGSLSWRGFTDEQSLDRPQPSQFRAVRSTSRFGDIHCDCGGRLPR